ncbi:hypothetical protein ACTXT7_008109 [Hymenolepis weldensis]
MEIISGLENSVSAVFMFSSVFIALFVRALLKLFVPSGTPQIHPESEQTVNEVTVFMRIGSEFHHFLSRFALYAALRFILKRFSLPEMQMEVSSDRSQIENNVDLFNHRYSGNPVSVNENLINQLRDLPVLLRYFWRVIFDGEGDISCLLRLRLIVLFLFVFFYVISPLDIFPESIVGVFGLLDDCLVCLVFCIYLGALFRGRLVADA